MGLYLKSHTLLKFLQFITKIWFEDYQADKNV